MATQEFAGEREGKSQRVSGKLPFSLPEINCASTAACFCILAWWFSPQPSNLHNNHITPSHLNSTKINTHHTLSLVTIVLLGWMSRACDSTYFRVEIQTCFLEKEKRRMVSVS